MRRATILQAVTALGLAAAVGAVVALTVNTMAPRPAEAQRKVTWKMASAFGSKLPHLGTSATRFADNVKVMSGGSLELKFFEPGALVRHPDHPDWGLGQVQSVIGARVTVNFEDAGKVAIDASKVALVYVGPDPRERM